MKKPLILYKALFNYSHQVLVKHVYAPSPAAAKARLINRIAREHGVHPSVVHEMFNGSRDNYTIEEVKT